MMILTTLFAAVTIAFPREGDRCPPVSQCYVIGATDGGETNLVVRGRNVPVYRTGAWGTLVDVVPGTNVVEVAGVRRTFVVSTPPPPSPTNVPERVYTKLPYSGDVAKAHPHGRKPSEITVVVDAGHGGENLGAVSPHGRPEKDINLRLSKAVERALLNRGYRVVMTRTDDAFPALYDRPKVAHREHADAFISIHHNAPAYDKDPTKLRYQTVYSWNALGDRLAKAINLRLVAARGDVENRGVMHANFAVTRNPEIPSCLVETDFITSPEGEEASWDPVRISATAAAIADGVTDWASVP